jgi:hypothetical protein
MLTSDSVLSLRELPFAAIDVTTTWPSHNLQIDQLHSIYQHPLTYHIYNNVECLPGAGTLQGFWTATVPAEVQTALFRTVGKEMASVRLTKI